MGRRPSEGAGAGAGVGAAQLFSLGEDASAAEFGVAVHRLLAEIEWSATDDDAENRARAWRERGVAAPVADEALACLRASELAGVWRKSAGAEAWRERAFELLVGDAWISGVFDRVVVERGADDRAQRATVFDFKTDAIAGEADADAAVARHAAQVNLYRRAVARLTGLAESAVAAELVFTRLRRRVPVPAASGS